MTKPHFHKYSISDIVQIIDTGEYGKVESLSAGGWNAGPATLYYSIKLANTKTKNVKEEHLRFVSKPDPYKLQEVVQTECINIYNNAQKFVASKNYIKDYPEFEHSIFTSIKEIRDTLT